MDADIVIAEREDNLQSLQSALEELAGGETYETLLRDAIVARHAGTDVRCASLPALLRMKLAANRPKDQAVIRRLREALASKTKS